MVDWAIYLSVLRQETVNNSVIPGKNECRPGSFSTSFFVAVFFLFLILQDLGNIFFIALRAAFELISTTAVSQSRLHELRYYT